MPLPSQTIVISKPFLVPAFDYQVANFVDNLSYNIVDVDNFRILQDNTGKYASPRLLNWVEPYPVNDVNKTLFYTEINTNIKVGDRVFIINGYYDSDLLIQNDKYKSGRDGYIVLYVDKCKIVLDIDYTGVLPFNDTEKHDDFIKVWRISTREEFLHVNKQISTRGGQLNYKFDKFQNNILYVDSSQDDFGPVYNEILPIAGTDSGTIAGYGVSLGLTGTPGFFVRNGLGYWVNISKELFFYGSFSVAAGTYSNNRMVIFNGNFIHNGIEFREGNVYEWNVGPTNSYWGVDKIFSKPLISRSNFRRGEFLGVFNTGIYGVQEKRISWKGELSKWFGGTLLNTLWLKGDLNSRISFSNLFGRRRSQDYIATFDNDGNPIQKSNTPNNGGRGYNFIIDSLIKSSNIENGTVINTDFGDTNTKTVLRNHLKSATYSFDISIKKGYFEDGKFYSLLIDNATLINPLLVDTKVIKSRVVNAQVIDSVIKDSTYISENSIKIRAYDEWNISEYRYTNLLNNPTGSSTYSIIKLNPPSSLPDSRTTHKLFKFYINEKDYKKLKLGDNFYINGININDNSKNPITFFDKKFKIGKWTEFSDDYSTSFINDDYSIERNNNIDNFYKRGFEYNAYISTPEENGYILNSITSSVSLDFLVTATISASANIVAQSTALIGTNSNSNYYSVDILVSVQDIINRDIDSTEYNFNYNLNPGTQATYLGNKIDISKAFISNSNFESGIFETSDWNNGYYINYNNDVNISSLTGSGTYKISINTSNNTLNVFNTQYDNINYKEFLYNVNDIVYLNSIDYINGDLITRLPDTYEVLGVNLNSLTLREVNTNVISGLTAGGYFKTNNSKNRYNYITKSKFYRSKIKSGLFKRSYISSSLIKTENYDSSDKDYVNMEKIKSLIISDTIFKNNDNILSSATYLNSFFIGGTDTWQDGIIQNSFLHSFTFSKGTIKESQWVNGVFLNGTFYNSKSFDGNATSDYRYYYDNRIKSYHIDGIVSSTVSNFRHAWVSGEFKNGQFFKSDWEDGFFRDGIFNYSKFYKGTFSNGIIGETKASSDSTVVYNGDIVYATVNNATLYSKDPNYLGATQTSAGSNINWYNGVFNNGLFGSYREYINILGVTQGVTYSNYIVTLNSTASTSTFYSSSPPDEKLGMSINQTNFTPVWFVGNNTSDRTFAGTTGFLVTTLSLSSNDYYRQVVRTAPFEIELKINLKHPFMGDLIINLKAPNGKIINVKKGGDGSSNSFNWTDDQVDGGIVFTTNDSNPTLQTTSQQYYNNNVSPNLKFRMSKSISVGSFGTYSFLSNSTSAYDLLNNDNTFVGDWQLIIIDEAAYDRGFLFNWSLNFKYDEVVYVVERNNNATWYNGIFNGGQFINYGKWKTGVFNSGRFTSAYGFSQSGLFFNNSNDPLTYSWENGTFNDGEFGNASLGENTTWHNGIFNGGEFKAKLWRNGIFAGGNFKGGTTFSATGGLDISNYTSNASGFVESYTQSFYGLWVDGIATNNKSRFMSEKLFWVSNKIPKLYNSISFDKVLWLSGTFSSDNGIFKNSVWLTGVFNKGKFQSSSFNPYVKRSLSGGSSYPLNLSSATRYSFTPDFNPGVNPGAGGSGRDRSTWVTGEFIESDFYMSRWLNGNFISGTAYGMIFFDGISRFMNAYNVIWEGGTWKNGNWYGSNFDYEGYVNNDFAFNIMRRGFRNYGYNTSVQPIGLPEGQQVSAVTGLNELHVWNLFKDKNRITSLVSSGGSSNISFDILSEQTSIYDFGTYSDVSTAFNPSVGGYTPPRPEDIFNTWDEAPFEEFNPNFVLLDFNTDDRPPRNFNQSTTTTTTTFGSFGTFNDPTGPNFSSFNTDVPLEEYEQPPRPGGFSNFRFE